RMYKHHEESIENMIKHYREDPGIEALFLIGSVATGTEREDSDLDALGIVSEEYYARKGALEVCHGKCTYKGGYFDMHYMTRAKLEGILKSGSEPMRNMFFRARHLYGGDTGLSELVAGIPVFQKSESPEKLFRFYCTMKMFHTYFWVCCKPEGFSRFHVAGGIVYNLYRLLLLENKVLFPSVRKLEEYVIRTPNKPEKIVERCRRLMDTLSDDACLDVVSGYEAWTSYAYPKEHHVVMNNFSDPYDWA
ncbi:MAG: nucleotidyltransferase domain-containing protein, partial [Treponema sp.]|nr:nucleotidyltransferase domain-containing protein [Treponema sp.]